MALRTSLVLALLAPCAALAQQPPPTPKPAPRSAPSAASREAFEAGVAFDLGQDGEPDPVRAREEYAIAASAGMPEAEFNLAVMLDSGIGTAIDRRQAAIWYARAAAHGFGRAAFDLAGLYARGDGVPLNPVLAARWFRLAADDGIAAAAARPVEPGEEPATALTPPDPVPVQVDETDRPAGTVPVEIVWTAPAMPKDGDFFLEVASVAPDGARHDIVWREVPVAAALVDLPGGAGRYAWRVFLASPSTGHYVETGWRPFTTGAAPDEPGRGPA